MNFPAPKSQRSPACQPSQPIKLLYITTIPGTLYFHLGQIGYMRQQGFEIHALSSPGALPEQLTGDNAIALHQVNMPRRITPWQDLIAIVQLWRCIRAIKPDLVHASTPKGGLLGTIAAALAGVPARLYQMRGLPMMTATGWKYGLLWLSEWVACHLAHRVLCVSHSLRGVAIAKHLVPADQITVLLGGSSNGVDALKRFNPSRFSPSTRQTIRQQYGIPEDAIVMGYVGRVVQDKGIRELVQAWQILRDRYPNLHLLMVGGFEPQDPISEEVNAALHQDDRIHLTDEVQDTAPFYTAMDLLTLPTYREGFPNVLLEAASMQLPIVATAIPGCIDAVKEQVTGTLVPTQDGEALAQALQQYLESPQLRLQHGQAGRDRILQEFNQEALWKALHQEYQHLLAQQGSLFAQSGALPAQM
ncbi:MAG: glycosyltransferase family 4 protein [Synechococcales bacterium]|nr:glycosyltransferase family 4 protein [Synechococcales bacterium]